MMEPTNEQLRMRTIIQAGDVPGLRAELDRDPAMASREVRFGPENQHSVPPLHLVCDAVFERRIDGATALEMAELLLGAGVDPNLAFAKSGDTFLISAASLGAESVGLCLLDAGAKVEARGLFGATALHWAAMMGLGEFVVALVDRASPMDQKADRYQCTPLDWALNAWSQAGSDRLVLGRVVRALVSAGSPVSAEAIEQGRQDPALQTALGL